MLSLNYSIKYIALVSILFLSGCLFYSPPKRDYFKFSLDSLESVPKLKYGFYLHEVGSAKDDENFIGNDDLLNIENYSLYEPIVLLPNNEFYWFYKDAALDKLEFCQNRVQYTIKNHSRKRSNNPYGIYKSVGLDTIIFEKVIPIRESGINLNYLSYGTIDNDTITIFKEIQFKRNKTIRVKILSKKFVYYPFTFNFKSPFE